jgi:hypothetical protein
MEEREVTINYHIRTVMKKSKHPDLPKTHESDADIALFAWQVRHGV